VPWASHDSAFTHQFEELVAYLARVTDKTSVSNLMGVSWRAVSGIVERIVGRRLDATRLDDLKRIGVDEFSYRKRHRYITTVVDHATGKVIWAGKGKGKKTLGKFFEALGKERAAKLETITMDMSGSFQAAVKEHAPQAQIVFDRFHVQKLASDALDKVRRELWRELQYEEDGHTIKKSRFALLKNIWNLTPRQRRKLSEIQKTNKPLYRAYLLKESLAKALDYLQPKRACEALDAWLTWAFRCRLKPFVKLARTIRKHKEGILAYIKDRLTNGIVEGINNRLRVVARRAYGYHSAEALIGMLFLNCGGIQLDPPLP
jgi:transposase